MGQVIQTRQAAVKESFDAALSTPIDRVQSAKKIALVRYFTNADVVRQIRRTIQRSENLTLRDLRAARVFRLVQEIAKLDGCEELLPSLHLGKTLYDKHKLDAIVEFTKCLCELLPCETKKVLGPEYVWILWRLYKRREGLIWVE